MKRREAEYCFGPIHGLCACDPVRVCARAITGMILIRNVGNVIGICVTVLSRSDWRHLTLTVDFESYFNIL